MSYQLQFRSLVTEFRKAGLNPDSAVRIARILGNSLQQVRRGPETTDTTSQKLRQVGPDGRKYQFENLDFDDGDPDFRSLRLESSEERQYPTQASTVQETRSPQETQNSFNVSPGGFVSVSSRGDGVEVGIDVSGTGPFLQQDPASGSLTGVSLRAESETGVKGLLRFFIEPRGDEYILKLQFDANALLSFIKEELGIEETVTNPNSEIPSSPTLPWDEAIVDVALTEGGLCFQKRNGEITCIPITTC